MATNLTRLNVALTASIGPFANAMKAAGGIAGGLGGALKSALLSPITAITGALTAGGFIAGIKAAGDRIDAMAKAADRLGISTQAFAGLTHAAEQSGASAEAMTQAVEKLSNKVQEAATGSKEAAKAIASVGLSVSELAALSPDQQFARVADAMNRLGTQGERTAATLDLFGKSGGQLANTLKLGSAGLAAMTDEAEALGLAISRTDAAKVEEAGDAFANVGKLIKGVFNQVAIAAAPFVTAMSNAFIDSAKGADGLGITVDNVTRFIVSAGGMVMDAWHGVQITWHSLVGVANAVASKTMDMVQALVMGAQWIGTKFGQAWAMVRSGAEFTWDLMAAGWAGAKVPIAALVTFAGEQMASLLRVSGTAIQSFDAALGASVLAASFTIAAGTGGIAAAAERDMAKAGAAAAASSQTFAAATLALYAPVVVAGNAALNELSTQFQRTSEQGFQAAESLKAVDWYSVGFTSTMAKLTGEADARAERTALELEDEQAKALALANVEAMGMEQRERDQSSWLAQMSANEYKHTRAAISGASSMFSNLSSLQESHSKTARRIGKAAAKAKIVTDTASAAMGAYSAMASIPFVGPALGIAAAAAAVVAGAKQLSNSQSDSGSVGSAPDQSVANIGGIAAPAQQASQNLFIQGDFLSVEALIRVQEEARERGMVIGNIRRA